MTWIEGRIPLEPPQLKIKCGFVVRKTSNLVLIPTQQLAHNHDPKNIC